MSSPWSPIHSPRAPSERGRTVIVARVRTGGRGHTFRVSCIRMRVSSVSPSSLFRVRARALGAAFAKNNFLAPPSPPSWRSHASRFLDPGSTPRSRLSVVSSGGVFNVTFASLSWRFSSFSSRSTPCAPLPHHHRLLPLPPPSPPPSPPSSPPAALLAVTLSPSRRSPRRSPRLGCRLTCSRSHPRLKPPCL